MSDTRTQDPWQEDGTDEGWVQDPYDDPYVEGESPEDDYDDEPLLYGHEGPNPRRTQAAVALVLAGIVFVGSLIVLASFNVASGPLAGLFDFWRLRTWVWVFFGVIMVFLVWLLALLVGSPAQREEDWYADDLEPPTAEYADTPGAADTITLRCPSCMNIFSLQDPWTRPFYHVCPHCETRGVYTGVQDPPEVKAQLERHGTAGA
jgi:hypothetical protein